MGGKRNITEPVIEGFIDVTTQVGKPGVYVITAMDTGTKYIGSAQDVCQRLGHHRYCLEKRCHHNPPLQEAYNAKAAFNFQVRHVETREEAYDLEQELLDRYRQTADVFNIALDVRSSNKGRTLSPAHAEALRQSRVGAVADEETREKMRQARYRNGCTLTDEGRERMRKINRDREHTEESRKKMSENVRAFYDNGGDATERGRKQSESLRRRAKVVEIEGVRYRSIPDAAEVLGLSLHKVRNNCVSTTDSFTGWKFVESEKS